jgi:hypothetical protein
MAVDLNVKCNFEITIRGITFTGKQGTATDGIDDAFVISVDGKAHCMPFELAVDTTMTLWDDDNDNPLDFDFMFIWADQNCFIQVINSATSFSVPHLAKVPFILAPKTDGLTAKSLGEASTTPMAAAPSVTEIDSVCIRHNIASTTLNGFCFFVD